MLSLKEIEQSLAGEKLEKELRTNIVGYWVYRKLSYPITWIFIFTGISANIVTLIGLLISIALPIMAVIANDFAYLIVGLFSFLGLLLDHVDGNIARVTKGSSDVGRLFDSFSGNVFWILLYISIGIIVDYENNLFPEIQNEGLLIGLIIS